VIERDPSTLPADALDVAILDAIRAAKDRGLTCREIGLRLDRKYATMLWRLTRLAKAGLLTLHSRVERTDASNYQRRIVRYTLAVVPATFEAPEAPWEPQAWVHPIRRAFLENKRCA